MAFVGCSWFRGGCAFIWNYNHHKTNCSLWRRRHSVVKLEFETSLQDLFSRNYHAGRSRCTWIKTKSVCPLGELNLPVPLQWSHQIPLSLFPAPWPAWGVVRIFNTRRHSTFEEWPLVTAHSQSQRRSAWVLGKRTFTVAHSTGMLTVLAPVIAGQLSSTRETHNTQHLMVNFLLQISSWLFLYNTGT